MRLLLRIGFPLSRSPHGRVSRNYFIFSILNGWYFALFMFLTSCSKKMIAAWKWIIDFFDYLETSSPQATRNSVRNGRENDSLLTLSHSLRGWSFQVTISAVIRPATQCSPCSLWLWTEMWRPRMHWHILSCTRSWAKDGLSPTRHSAFGCSSVCIKVGFDFS